MTRVRLEIDHLTIHRPKKRWRLYFIVVTEHPTDPDKLVVSMIPPNSILVVPDQQNTVYFESEGNGTNGLLVLSRAIPEDRELNVHLYVMHSRRSLNEIGKTLEDIEKGIGGDALGLVTDILGTTNPWLLIARRALPLIGQVMEKIPDRNMGFISMFERFGKEFKDQVELDREARGGNVTVVYSWSVER